MKVSYLHVITVICLAGCGGPVSILPGGALDGVAASAESWAFAVEFETLALETRPSDPYSVNIGFVLKDDRLYIDPASERRWYPYIVAQTNVRVRFADGKIYEARAVPVTDPGEREGFDPDRHVLRLELRN
jgi:hypothetical protein